MGWGKGIDACKAVSLTKLLPVVGCERVCGCIALLGLWGEMETACMASPPAQTHADAFANCTHLCFNPLTRIPLLLRPAVCLQAQKLDEMLAKKGESIDKVLNFVVPDSLLVSWRCRSAAQHSVRGGRAVSSRLGGQSWALTLRAAGWLCTSCRKQHSPTRPRAVRSLAPLAHSSPLS